MIKLGIVGCGSIGTIVAEAVKKNYSSVYKLICLSDKISDRAKELAEKSGPGIRLAGIDELVKECDLVLEAAAPDIAPYILGRCIANGKDAMIMSSGGLIDRADLFEAAREKGIRVFIPSGAVSGIDAVKAARIAGIDEIVLTTKKPPEGLLGAPYIKENGIDLDSVKEETVIFDGTARDAMKNFPNNINVSATLSICGVGADKTRVRIVVVPGSKANSHQLTLKARSGIVRTVTENLPMPGNPKTSYLAAVSAVACLEGIVSSVRAGT